MAVQNAPEVAVDYSLRQRRAAERVRKNAALLWRQVGAEFDDGFERISLRLLISLNAAQQAATERASTYYPEVLAATGQGRQDRPEWDVEPTALMGTAGDGRPTESLMYGAVTTAKTAVADGASILEAQRQGGAFLDAAIATVLADTARSAEVLAHAARPLSGYVRMLTPPSCGRCVILAGKRYKSGTAFKRHPGCDCVHIPAPESIAGDMTTAPTAYLDSLDDATLAKALGSKSNATAYREYGADPFQLINAYRQPGGRRGPGGIPSIQPAQIPTRVVGADGRIKTQYITVKSTLEGTTVRGYAASQMRHVRQLTTVKRPGERYSRVVAPRLMPESILAIAKNKDHARRLLIDHGWIK